jgi:hypothetical protein
VVFALYSSSLSFSVKNLLPSRGQGRAGTYMVGQYCHCLVDWALSVTIQGCACMRHR